MQKLTPEKLTPEIVLRIFKCLNSLQMVRMMPVCKDWLAIIEHNKSLWRKVDLPRRAAGWRWDPSVLEHFDRRSQSTLTEVSMYIECMHDMDFQQVVMPLLKKSKATLRFISIGSDEHYWTVDDKALSEAPFELPRLKECYLYSGRSLARLVRDQGGGGSGVQENHGSSCLEVLWTSKPPVLRKSQMGLLDNLVSLCWNRYAEAGLCRAMFKGPSKKLKHLRVHMIMSENDLQLTALQFPKLRLIEVGINTAIGDSDPEFPHWMKIPSTSTLVSLNAMIPIAVPSVSAFRSEGYKVHRLEDRLPVLSELRVDFALSSWGYNIYERTTALLHMLAERAKRAKDRFKVDGIVMIPLKKLYLPFRYLDDEQLATLRGLAEEVLDLENAPQHIEVRI